MSLRIKITLTFTVLAGLAAIVASSLSYSASSQQLYQQIDQSLITISQASVNTFNNPIERQKIINQSLNRVPGNQLPSPGALGNQVFATQFVSSDGIVILPGQPQLPVSGQDLRLAKQFKGGKSRIGNVVIENEELRIATTPLVDGGIIQVARSVDDIALSLEALRTKVITLSIIIVIIAALLGFLLASTVTRPLERLTASAEKVAASGQPDEKITVSGRDEIGRLGRVLSRMLASLDRSRQQQERLVQDAGHELRTPLTAITTNIAILNKFDNIEPERKKQILTDLGQEASEMSEIINDLVALTTIGEDEEVRPIDLDHLIEEVANQGQRRFDREIVIRGRAGQIEGRPRALRHAIFNLLDNAAKFDKSKQPIVINVSDSEITVRDNGPGIEAGSEELIFERFHRSVNSRSEPGSGLGLSIVAEVARQHGGKARARNHPDGGAEIGFSWN